jgi:hypothetical protein
MPPSLENIEKRGPPMAAVETLAWRMWGARTSGEDLVAQAVKVVTASTTAASALAADGGHTRKRRVSSVRATSRVMVAQKRRRCQAAEAGRSGMQVRDPLPRGVCLSI